MQNGGSGAGAGWAAGTSLGWGAAGFKKFMGTHGEAGGLGTTTTWSGGKGGDAARYSGSPSVVVAVVTITEEIKVVMVDRV